jgi:hypothetical protein
MKRKSPRKQSAAEAKMADLCEEDKAKIGVTLLICLASGNYFSFFIILMR